MYCDHNSKSAIYYYDDGHYFHDNHHHYHLFWNKYDLSCSNDPTLKPFAQQLTHGDLRAQVCETVFDAGENFQLALIPDDNNATEVNLHDWAENMKKDKFWVDHPFIQLTANLLKRNIVIITIHKEDGTNGSGRLEIEANETNGCPLYLLNYDNIHFQSIFLKGLEDSTSN